jgi:hypothetical protein
MANVSRALLSNPGYLQIGRQPKASVQIQKQVVIAGQFHHIAMPVAFPMGQI